MYFFQTLCQEVCGVLVVHADKAYELADLRMLDGVLGTTLTTGWKVVNRPVGCIVGAHGHGS